MTLTPDEWETELESVEQVAVRDTIPAPPPTEPLGFEIVSAPRPFEPGDHTCGGFGDEPCLACAPEGDQGCDYCGELFEHASTCPNRAEFE